MNHLGLSIITALYAALAWHHKKCENEYFDRMKQKEILREDITNKDALEGIHYIFKTGFLIGVGVFFILHMLSTLI
jgi:hypothetical protein